VKCASGGLTLGSKFTFDIWHLGRLNVQSFFIPRINLALFVLGFDKHTIRQASRQASIL